MKKFVLTIFLSGLVSACTQPVSHSGLSFKSEIPVDGILTYTQ